MHEQKGDGLPPRALIRQAEKAASRNPVPIVALTAHVIGEAADRVAIGRKWMPVI